MSDYIDRKRAANFLCKIICGSDRGLCVSTPENCRQKRMLEFFELPASDVVPVVRGEWEWQEEWGTFPNTDVSHLRRYGWYCKRCGIELGEYLTKSIGRIVDLNDDFSKPDLKYCPNCGADMRGETK